MSYSFHLVSCAFSHAPVGRRRGKGMDRIMGKRHQGSVGDGEADGQWAVVTAIVGDKLEK